MIVIDQDSQGFLQLKKIDAFKLWLQIHRCKSYTRWRGEAGRIAKVPHEIEWGKPEEAAQ